MLEENIQDLFQCDDISTDHAFEAPYTVRLVMPSGDKSKIKEPFIEALSYDGRSQANSFALSSLLTPALSPHQVHQIIGDGPCAATMPVHRVRQAAQMALDHITRHDGHFEVVWVPNDPLLPF